MKLFHGRGLHFIILATSLWAFESCTPPTTKTLLISPTQCSSDDEFCNEATQTKIEGELSITVPTTLFAPLEGSDLVEISGTCNDLGRKENKIEVAVYNGEDTTNPYVINSTSAKCLDQSIFPINNFLTAGTDCFFIGLGAGALDATQVYPQCFNGRFSFTVKLGRILRQSTASTDDNTNPKLKYLVRARMITQDPIGVSGWAQTLVTRELSKPTFAITPNFTDHRCEISVYPQKYKESTAVAYNLKKDVSGAFGTAVSTDETLWGGGAGDFIDYVDDLDASDYSGFSLRKYYDNDIIPGITVSYSINAIDQLYPLPGPILEESGYTDPLTCEVPAPVIPETAVSLPTVACAAKTCSIAIKEPGAYNYQWYFKTGNSGWTGADALPTTATEYTDCAGLASCTIYLNHGSLNPGCATPQSYFFAARVVDGPLVGKWSNVVDCKFQ